MSYNVIKSVIKKWKLNRKHVVEILLKVHFIAPSVSKRKKEASQYSKIYFNIEETMVNEKCRNIKVCI